MDDKRFVEDDILDLIGKAEDDDGYASMDDLKKCKAKIKLGIKEGSYVDPDHAKESIKLIDNLIRNKRKLNNE